MQTYDLAVIGSGIIGSLAAHTLSDIPGSLVLIDRDGLCAGTSRASEGNLLVSDRTGDKELRLMQRSLELWRPLADEMGEGFEWEAKGSLLVARQGPDLAALARHMGWLRERGVDCEFMTATVPDLEPALSDRVAGVGWFPNDAQIQPMLACYRIAERLRAKGVELRLYDGVARLRRAGRSVVLDLESGVRLAVGRVVVCAGVWSAELFQPLGAILPVVPRRGHIAVVEGDVTVRTKLLDFSYHQTLTPSGEPDASVQIAAVVESTRSGTLLCGSSRQFAGFDGRVDVNTVAAILRACVELVPGLRAARVLRAYVGLRPYSPDGMPLIGWLDADRTVCLATGHEGSGHGLAAVTGAIVRDLMLGRDPAFRADVDPLRFPQAVVAG